MIRIQLPSEKSSWRELPANPLDGFAGAKSEQILSKDDYLHFCDACQKGFHSKARFDEHMGEHIFCPFPGCNFTCRKDKQWRLELHQETLHNRPDAPDLADTDKYLTQRRKRFPTTETIKTKVEEIFYKASRGEILPDERRRWMRQHGVVIRKRQRNDESFIVAEAQQRAPRVVVTQQVPVAEKRAVRQRLVPMGPNGRLTKAQQVLLVREKYREATQVPRFYVCNRCGTKGEHWVADCPTRGDEQYDKKVDWAEARKAHEPSDIPSQLAEATETEEKERLAEGVELPQAAEADVAPPTQDAPQDMPPNKTPHDAAEVTTRSVRRGAYQPRRSPTLFDRLVEGQSLNDHGLLLQAVRFFCANDFLCDE